MKIHSNQSVNFFIENPFFQKKEIIDSIIGILDESFIYFGKNIKYDWSLNLRTPLTKAKYTKVIFPYIAQYLNGLGYKNFAIKGFGAFPFAGLTEYGMESFLMIRDQEKDYGIRKQIEGDIDKSKKLVLIDDLANQGTQLKKAKHILEKNGYRVDLVFSLAKFKWNQEYHKFYDAKFESIIDLNWK